MSVIDPLASSLGRRDEGLNQELARQLAETEDRATQQEHLRRVIQQTQSKDS